MPKKTKYITKSVRLSPADFDKAIAIAKYTDIPFSSHFRAAWKEYLRIHKELAAEAYKAYVSDEIAA